MTADEALALRGRFHNNLTKKQIAAREAAHVRVLQEALAHPEWFENDITNIQRYRRRWYEDNREKRLAYKKQWRAEHRAAGKKVT